MYSKIIRMKTNHLSLFNNAHTWWCDSNPKQLTTAQPFGHLQKNVSIEDLKGSSLVVAAKQPSLIYVQNPITWLRNKLRLKLLRYTWDRDFEESEFKRGATKATVVMTEHLRENKLNEIQRLTTPKGFVQISKDLHVSQNDPRVQLLRFRTQDIRRHIPVRIHFMESRLKRRHCFIDMFFVGLRRIDDLAEAGEVRQLVQQYRRQLEMTGHDVSEEFDVNEAAVFAEIYVRFHKEYSEMSSQQWNIAFYKVASFDLLHIK